MLAQKQTDSLEYDKKLNDLPKSWSSGKSENASNHVQETQEGQEDWER